MADDTGSRRGAGDPDGLTPLATGPGRRPLRALGLWLILGAGSLVVVPMLFLAGLIRRYDLVSYGRHAATIRRLLPRRVAGVLAPALPLLVAAKVWSASGGGTSSPMVVGLWLAVGVAAAELYSVCLHREAWIASFEPWWLPDDARPLLGTPLRPEDQRLQQLFRLQVVYSLAPVLMLVTLPGTSWDWPTALLMALFMAKFFGHAAADYEVIFHWDLHCAVLRLADRPRTSAVVAALATWYLGPLHGYVPLIYPVEHMLIHHPGNSGPQDVHSPLPYRRTSLLEFCAFALTAAPSYLLGVRIIGNRRVDPARRWRMRVGIAAYWLVVGLLLLTDRPLAIWLLWAALHRAVTATRSQYLWHGLIDLDRVVHPTGSTIVWVGRDPDDGTTGAGSTAGSPTRLVEGTNVPVPGTDWAFFDNHHLVHHLRPRAHFADYPALLADASVRRATDEAIALDLAALPTFAQDCWTGRLERIAEHVVSPDGGDVVTLLRERLEPLPSLRTRFAAVTETALADRMDGVLGQLLYRLTGGL